MTSLLKIKGYIIEITGDNINVTIIPTKAKPKTGFVKFLERAILNQNNIFTLQDIQKYLQDNYPELLNINNKQIMPGLIAISRRKHKKLIKIINKATPDSYEILYEKL